MNQDFFIESAEFPKSNSVPPVFDHNINLGAAVGVPFIYHNGSLIMDPSSKYHIDLVAKHMPGANYTQVYNEGQLGRYIPELNTYNLYAPQYQEAEPSPDIEAALSSHYKLGSHQEELPLSQVPTADDDAYPFFSNLRDKSVSVGPMNGSHDEISIPDFLHEESPESYAEWENIYAGRHYPDLNYTEIYPRYRHQEPAAEVARQIAVNHFHSGSHEAGFDELPESDPNAMEINRNYPFLVDDRGQMLVGPYRGYHANIFQQNPRLMTDPRGSVSIKGRYHPFLNHYYLYPGSPDSPELQQQVHQTFNAPDSPYQDHLDT